MFRLPLIATVLTFALTAAPPVGAEAWQPGLSHAVEGRFGVVYERDRTTGLSATRPLADVRYTATWRMQSDHGWRIGVAVAIQAGNLLPHRPAMQTVRR